MEDIYLQKMKREIQNHCASISEKYSSSFLNFNPSFISRFHKEPADDSLNYQYLSKRNVYLWDPSSNEAIQSHSTSNIVHSRLRSPPRSFLQGQHVKECIVEFSNIATTNLFSCSVCNLLICFFIEAADLGRPRSNFAFWSGGRGSRGWNRRSTEIESSEIHLDYWNGGELAA